MRKDAGLTLVPPSIALSCLLLSSWVGAGLSVGGAGCREPPPLVRVSPSHGSLPRTKTWERSRGPRLLRVLLSSKVPWKQARQSEPGMGAERGQLGRVSHPGTPGTGPSPTHLSL